MSNAFLPDENNQPIHLKWRKEVVLNYEKLREDTIIYGSPESVIEKIKYMEEVTGADSLILHFPPYNTREQNARVLAQFAEDVIPKFR